MYELRPIIASEFPIELPDCMYRLKNIHDDSENELVMKIPSACTKSVGTFKQKMEYEEMAELEDRQKKLLMQLDEVKKIMQLIRATLNLPSSTIDASSCVKKSSQNICKAKLDIPDIVINVNPLYPPYFLSFLQKLLKEELSLKIMFYLHSSVSSLPAKCEMFTNKIKAFQSNGVPSINLRLIWKEIGHLPELSTPHFSIQGEANILRYLVRMLDNNLNYEKYSNPEIIDSLLDLSYVIANSRSFKGNIAQSLIKYATKSKWLGNQNKITIADIALYDSLKKFANCNELSGDLSKWFQQCEQYTK